MKITIEFELDQAAYDLKYGPGSDHWRKYRTERVKDGGRNQYGDTYHDIPLSFDQYEFAPSKVQATMEAMIKDMLSEGFYDWHHDGQELNPKITIGEG